MDVCVCVPSTACLNLYVNIKIIRKRQQGIDVGLHISELSPYPLPEETLIAYFSSNCCMHKHLQAEATVIDSGELLAAVRSSGVI